MNVDGGRKEMMLQVARELFVTHGFRATSLDMIIARTGGSRRNIYALFGDKDGLIQAVLQSIAQDVMQEFQKLPPPETEPAVWLEALGNTYLNTFTQRDVVGMFREIIFLAKENADIGKVAYLAGPELLQKWVSDYLRFQCDRGGLQIADVDMAARIFVGMIRGDHLFMALMTSAGEPNNEETEKYVSEVVAIFLRGTAGAR